MSERVNVVGPYGEQGSVDAADLPSVVKAGGRQTTPEEEASIRADAEYAKKSTGEKIGSALSMAGPGPMLIRGAYKLATGQGAELAPSLPPTVNAYLHGVSNATTGGLQAAAVHEAIKAAAGDEAAKAFAQNVDDVKKAHSGLYNAGQAAGFLASVVSGGPKAGLGKAVLSSPAGAIGAAGGAAEQYVARGLAGVAAKGVAGRALATGVGLGVRGGVESALYGAANEVSDEILGDRDISGSKIAAAAGMGGLLGLGGGFVLGGAGSLAASGARGIASKVTGGLSRLAGRAEEGVAAAEGAAEGVAAKTEGVAAKAEGVAAEAEAKAAPEAAKESTAIQKAMAGQGDEAARQTANDLAWKALGTTKKLAAKVAEDIPGGTNAVGDYVMRRILKPDAEEGILSSVYKGLKGGRADDLLPAIQADKAKIGEEIGDAIKMTPATVKQADLMKAAEAVGKEMASDPTKIQGVSAFNDRVAQTFEALTNGGKVSASGEMSLADMYYTRAKLESVAHELGRDTAANAGFKSWLREVDSQLVSKLDEAAKAAGKEGQGDAIRALKREYQLASVAEHAAEDGANRVQGNNIFGIREGIGAMAGLATGHPLAAIGSAVFGKIARERGAAAGAVLLSRMADMGMATKAVQSMDELIGRATRGVLEKPKAIAAPFATQGGKSVERAQASVAAISKLAADPDRFANHITEQTQALAATSPELASSVQATMTRTMAFLSSKIPVHADRDPLDPHPVPKMTDAQAAEYCRYEYYALEPKRFFEDMENGKVLPEGIEAVQAVMGDKMWNEFIGRMTEAVSDQLARGVRIPFEQRQKLGLMGVNADPSQRPDHMKFLQANVQAQAEAASMKAKQGVTAPRRPLPTKTQPSTLDRLEGR